MIELTLATGDRAGAKVLVSAVDLVEQRDDYCWVHTVGGNNLYVKESLTDIRSAIEKQRPS